eukprot:scaffold24233_cov37-Cyclotella_meneghiniana.AAC.2
MGNALAKKRHVDDTNNNTTAAAEPRTKRSKKDKNSEGHKANSAAEGNAFDDDSYNSATFQRTKDDNDDDNNPDALNMAAGALLSLQRNVIPITNMSQKCEFWERYFRMTAGTRSLLKEVLNAEHEHKDQHREKPDSEVGYFQGYFDDSRNGERNLVHTAPENFRNTSFLRCIPREWLELTPYQHARLMAPLLMANACLQRKRYTYKGVINNEDTPVQNFISFLKIAVTVLYHKDYISIGNTFGKKRYDKKEAGKFVEADRRLEDSAAGEPAAEKRQKLEAKWGVQVHYRLSPEAWNSYVTGVNKNKRRKTLQFGIFFKSEDDVKARKTIGGTALLIPLKKHAINICERLMSKLEIHCEKQQLEQQLIIDLVTEIIISQQEEVIGDIHHLGSFETIDVDDRFHRALRSICIIIGHLIYNSIILIRQGTFFKQDDETKHLKSTLAGDDSDSSRAGS